MERTLLADLWAWKQNPRRKPLVLQGARQVGKTWLLREFGRAAYARVVEVNLEKAASARRVFAETLEAGRIVASLALVDGRGPIDPATTLIIFDEVQEAPQALASLKYFCEDAPEYHVACAGSFLGVGLHAGTTFPVGKVDFLTLAPLSLAEFLAAHGQAALLDALRAQDFTLLGPFHEALVGWLKRFFVVGGMPEAVQADVTGGDLAEVRTIQRAILRAYDQDLSKHAPAAEVPRIRAVLGSVPRQLARENRKFVFGQVRQGARARDLEMALQWLEDAGHITKLRRVGTPRLPLASYADERSFKVFLADVGLLGAAAELDPAVIIGGDSLFTEFKGALTEQYVLQEIVASGLPTPYYWTSDAGSAEVDFLVQSPTGVIPVEVKAATNLRAKSLRVYRDRYAPPLALRLSMARFEVQGGLVCLPLYATPALAEIVTSGTPGLVDAQPR